MYFQHSNAGNTSVRDLVLDLTGTQFTCFTGKKVRMLTRQLALDLTADDEHDMKRRTAQVRGASIKALLGGYMKVLFRLYSASIQALFALPRVVEP